jgi:sugar/nucleoside kinase (ribokinase family)
MKILTIGGATYDIIIGYPDAQILYRATTSGKQGFLELEEGKKLELDSVVYKTGGGATNSAVSFARLGLSVESFFKIGDDFQGRIILELLASEGVATSHVCVTSELPTSVSFIIASPKTVDRTLLVYRGASRLMAQYELPLDSIASSDAVYCSSLSGPAVSLLPIITQEAKKHGRFVAANPSSSQLKAGAPALCAALATIDLLIMNRYEASLLMHSLAEKNVQFKAMISTSYTPPRVSQAPQLLVNPLVAQDTTCSLPLLLKAIMALGPSLVVVTNGAEGVYVGCNEGILFHPSLPVKAVSSLGAGDAFGAGFTAGIVQGFSVDQAMRMGILNSSSVVLYGDAKTGLLTKKEMDQKLVALDQSLLFKIAMPLL